MVGSELKKLKTCDTRNADDIVVDALISELFVGISLLIL